MADDIARLGIKVESGQVKAATKDLKRLEGQGGKTEGSMKGLGKSVSGVVGSLGRMVTSVGALAGVGGVAGLGALTLQAVEFADAIGKVADKVGFTTDALQELRFGAEQSGVSTGTLDMALQRFSRRVGEAANGSGELKDTLIQLGISTKNTDGSIKSAEQVLYEYADAIQAAGSQQERLRLAFKGFDSEGAALVNLLRGGREELQGFAMQAREAGIVMDESLIRQSEIINNKWNKLSNTIGVKFKSALIDTAATVLEVFGFYSDLAGVQKRILELENEILRQEDRLNGKIRGRQETIKSINAMKAELEGLLKEQETFFEQQRRIDELREGATGGGSASGPTKEEQDAAKKKEEELARIAEKEEAFIIGQLERVRMASMTQLELLQENLEQRSFVIEEAFQAGLITDEERQRLIEELEARHQERLTKITNKGLSDRQKFEKMSTKQRVAFQLGELTQMTQGVAQQNKALFEVNKALALANAAVTLPDAVLTTYRNNGGYPWGIIPAGLMLATGLAQIQAINSAQFGSGGGAPSLATAGGAAPTIAVDQTGATIGDTDVQQATNVTVVLEGGLHDSNSIRDLIGSIADELGDGVQIETQLI